MKNSDNGGNSPLRPHLSTVILAAGASQRMGSPKALLPTGSETLLSYQVNQFRPFCRTIYVVIGADAAQIQAGHPDLGVKWLLNETYQQGMSSSVRLGAKALIESEAEAAFIAPLDHMTHHTVLESLSDAFKHKPSPLISPQMNSRNGHPFLIHRDLYTELQQVQEESQGLRALVKKYEHQIQKVQVDWWGVIQDMDTLEDYRKLSSLLR